MPWQHGRGKKGHILVVAKRLALSRSRSTKPTAFFTPKNSMPRLDAEGWRRSASISNTLKPELAADAANDMANADLPSLGWSTSAESPLADHPHRSSGCRFATRAALRQNAIVAWTSDTPEVG